MQDMTNHQSKKKSVPSPLCPRSRVHREKVRMRGYKIKQLSSFIPSPQPFYARAAGCSRGTQKTGHKGEGVNGTAGVFCFLAPVSCLLSPVFCLLSPVFWILTPGFWILDSVSCLLDSVSCLLSSVFCLLDSGFWIPAPGFCLLPSVSKQPPPPAPAVARQLRSCLEVGWRKLGEYPAG